VAAAVAAAPTCAARHDFVVEGFTSDFQLLDYFFAAQVVVDRIELR